MLILFPHTPIVSKAASSADRVLGMLENTLVSRDAVLCKRLYTTYVRPHLKYGVQVWNPHAKNNIKTLEKVQRRATKVPHSLEHLNDEERLKNLNLTTLKVRKEIEDLIQLHKKESDLNKVNWVVDYERGPSRRVRLQLPLMPSRIS